MTDDLCPICRRPYSAGPCRVTGAVAVMLAAVFVACAFNACGHARNAVHAVTPTAPRAEGTACPAPAWRCTANVPEHCVVSDGQARFYPLHPIGDDGRPAPCASRCVLDTVAHCAPAEVQP